MRNKEMALNYAEWARNAKNDRESLWKNRVAKLQAELEAMELKFTLVTQSGAEQIMKNVAKRMLNRDLARMLIAWSCNWRDDARARWIMKGVGGRWMNREASDAVRSWHEKYFEEKSQARAEAIMRRVGGRMRNKEMALNYAEWARNAKNDRESLWKNRVAKLQAELDELQVKFTLVTQSGAEQIMKNVAKRMLNGDLARMLIAWSCNWGDEKREKEARERGEAIMKRVGGRWMNREASDAVR